MNSPGDSEFWGLKDQNPQKTWKVSFWPPTQKWAKTWRPIWGGPIPRKNNVFCMAGASKGRFGMKKEWQTMNSPGELEFWGLNHWNPQKTWKCRFWTPKMAFEEYAETWIFKNAFCVETGISQGSFWVLNEAERSDFDLFENFREWRCWVDLA